MARGFKNRDDNTTISRDKQRYGRSKKAEERPQDWYTSPFLVGRDKSTASTHGLKSGGCLSSGTVLGRRLLARMQSHEYEHELDGDLHGGEVAHSDSAGRNLFSSYTRSRPYTHGVAASLNHVVTPLEHKNAVSAVVQSTGGGASPPSPASQQYAVSGGCGNHPITAVCCDGLGEGWSA